MFSESIGGRCNAHDNGSVGQFNKWRLRRRYDIQASLVSATLTNCPVMLDDTILDADHFNDASGSLRASSDYQGNTRLSLEVIFWDTVNNKGAIYIKVASISSVADTPIYIFSGRSGTSQPAVGAAYGQYSVWSNAFAAMYHLNETGGAGTVDNSASASYTGNKKAASEPTASTTVQKLERAADFDGTDDYINCGDIIEMDSVTEFTWSCVYRKKGAFGSFQQMLSQGVANNMRNELSNASAAYNSVNDVAMVIANGGISLGWTQTAPLATGTYYHIAAVYNGNGAANADRLKIYVDGSEITPLGFQNTIPATTAGPQTWNLYMGIRYNTTANPCDMLYQNCRIHSTNRNAAWINFEYRNWFDMSNLIIFNPLIP